MSQSPEHYQALPIQPVVAMQAWLTAEQYQGFLLGNVIKYVARFNAKTPDKGGVEDLIKAADYLQRAITWEQDA